MKLIYSLAKTYRERAFVETGAELPVTASVELPTDALTPALRAHLARTVAPRVPAEFTLTNYVISFDAARVVAATGDRITLDTPATDGDAPRLLAEDAARWEDADARRQVRAAERAEEHRQAAERNTVEAARRQAEAIADAQAKAQREADKVAWVAAHGSEFLRKACGAGYDCQRKYVAERAATEFPGYVVDWNDKAAWRDRSCPSESALDEALRTGGLVVWLTVSGVEDDYDFEAREAVVVREYLGKYDLIKTL